MHTFPVWVDCIFFFLLSENCLGKIIFYFLIHVLHKCLTISSQVIFSGVSNISIVLRFGGDLRFTFLLDWRGCDEKWNWLCNFNGLLPTLSDYKRKYSSSRHSIAYLDICNSNCTSILWICVLYETTRSHFFILINITLSWILMLYFLYEKDSFYFISLIIKCGKPK